MKITATYTGPLARGRVRLPHRTVAFERGVELPVSAAEADLLDLEEWTITGATPPAPADPYADLDKPALLQLAEDRGVDVSPRWGAPRLREALAASSPSPDTDHPADTATEPYQEPTS